MYLVERRPQQMLRIGILIRAVEDQSGLNLTIEGHTDNIGHPITTCGCPMGADNSTDAGRSKNRRVELIKTA